MRNNIIQASTFYRETSVALWWEHNKNSLFHKNIKNPRKSDTKI